MLQPGELPFRSASCGCRVLGPAPQSSLSLRSDMAQFAALCLLLSVVRVQSQFDFFRTELFPEQLQQQQVQLVQRQIQDHLQLLQAQAQTASSVEQQVSVSVCHGSYRVGYLSVQKMSLLPLEL